VVLDAATGVQIASLPGHTDKIAAVAWSADGSRAMTGSGDGTVKIWNAATLEEERTLSTGEVFHAVLSPDGGTVAVSTGGTAASLYDADTGAYLRGVGHSNTVLSVAFSPDGTKLLTGSEDMTAKMWDVATAALLRTFSGGTLVLSAAFSPDGTKVLLSEGMSLRMLDAATGNLVRSFLQPAMALFARFSADGTRVVAGVFAGQAVGLGHRKPAPNI